MAAVIVGWAHSKFGKFDDQTLESLITGVTRDAIAHAAVDATRIDGIWLGHFNAGLVPESFCSSLVLQADDALRWTPATRVENACASGAAAIYAAADAIAAGRARIALVVGAEKMTAVSGPEVTRSLGSASYVSEEAAIGMDFPGLFAGMANTYFARYGDQSVALAQIAAKNHANGVRNPYAHMRKDLGFEFCNTVSERNPMIAAPLRKTDCSLVSDGAAALVMVDETLLPEFRRGVRFRAREQVSDFLPILRRDVASFAGPQRAWQRALAAAGCRIHDLSLAEVHDCFTIAELLSYEAMGLAPAGQGATLLEDGAVFAGGALPVNASGGLKAKGHPIGATGVSMHVIAAMQLCNEAGTMQIPGANLAGVFNMGGAAVASYVSILEAAR
jgi:acetyl-CoA C-acetyltransferase